MRSCGMETTTASHDREEDPVGPGDEFRDMVKALAGIEIILNEPCAATREGLPETTRESH